MMTDKECRLMKIAMDASEVSIAALQMAQANGYLKTREAKSRLLDAIVSLNFAINTSVFDEKDIAYMAAKYRKMEEKICIYLMDLYHGHNVQYTILF